MRHGADPTARLDAAIPLALLLLLILTSTIVEEAQHRGKVVSVTDGDTIAVLIDRHPRTICLAEIDTPEKGQPWANRAKQALSSRIYGQAVLAARETTAPRPKPGRVTSKINRTLWPFVQLHSRFFPEKERVARSN